MWISSGAMSRGISTELSRLKMQGKYSFVQERQRSRRDLYDQGALMVTGEFDYDDKVAKSTASYSCRNFVLSTAVFASALALFGVFGTEQVSVPLIGYSVMMASQAIIFALSKTDCIGAVLESFLSALSAVFIATLMILKTGGFCSPFTQHLYGIFAASFTSNFEADMNLYVNTYSLVCLALGILLLHFFGYIPVKSLEYSKAEYPFVFIIVMFTVLSNNGIKIGLARHLIALSFNRESNANLLKSKFIASVSHGPPHSNFLRTQVSLSHSVEIRTPLTTILGWTELIKLEAGCNKKLTEKLNIIKKSGEHLLSILNDLLDFSRLEREQVQLEREVFDLKCSIDIALDSIKVLVKPGVELIRDIDLNGFECIIGDSHRLNQVIINIASNAAKFTPSGSITFRVHPGQFEKSTNQVEFIFSVSDTGIGIEESALPPLFMPFFQADSSVARKYGGSGLGLSISKELVEMMGGHIGVCSKVGIGSTFTWNLWLEAKMDNNLGKDEASCDIPQEPIKNGRSIQVLLVEDNKMNQEMVKAMLRRGGYEIETADNGLEAIDKVKTKQFDVILMDFQMPVLDGISATEAMREMNIESPIIGLTANADEITRRKALEVGMNSCVTKPIRINDLLIAIERCLQD